MTPTSRRRGRPCDVGRIRWPYVVTALIVLLAAGGFGAYEVGALDRWFGDGDDESALDVEPPDKLEFPGARTPQPVLGSAEPAALDAGAVKKAVRKVMKRHNLGKHSGIAVMSLNGGRPAVTMGSGSYLPASTLKNFTSLAALHSMGSDERFTTSVVREQGTASKRVQDITIVGGGDPLLATNKRRSEIDYPEPATLAQLAKQTATALEGNGEPKVRLRYDNSLFKGPDVSPHWKRSYISTDVTTPVSALWVDEGMDAETGDRTEQPARDAAKTFAGLLEKRGVQVKGGVSSRTAPNDVEDIASVTSPTLAQIVRHLLETSDNQAAEVVLRHLAISEGRPASFDGGVRAMKSVLTSMGVPWKGVSVYDGSGLSRDNRVTLKAELAVLRIAATSRSSDTRPLIDGLPVAGFSGSLGDRFTAPSSDAALGVARAKTGTLSGVHAYAGTTTDKSGTPLLFVAIANKVKDKLTLDARAGLDDIAAALTSCACSR